MFSLLSEPSVPVLAGDAVLVQARWAAECSKPLLDLLDMDKNGNVSHSTFACNEARVELVATCSSPCVVASVRDGLVAVSPSAPGAFSFELEMKNLATGETARQTFSKLEVRVPDAVGLWCTSTGKNFEPCSALRPTAEARVQVVAETGASRVTLSAFRVNGRTLRSGELGVAWAEFAPDVLPPGPRVFELEAGGLKVTRTLEVLP